jgi:cytochrome b pre-mRNA-processing protein 3
LRTLASRDVAGVLKHLQRSTACKALARRLHATFVAQARKPDFFGRFRVPDTMDGRFDLMTLHGWLVLERLGPEPDLAQALIDEVFAGFEEALRQLGSGDMGMNRRLKIMANAFYGRLQAYRGSSSLEDLTEAIWRNLYRGNEDRRADAIVMATYAYSARSHLARSDVNRELDFGSLPPK